MAERSNAAVLKTVDLRGSGGSNPSLSTNPQNFISRVNKVIKMQRASTQSRTGDY